MKIDKKIPIPANGVRSNGDKIKYTFDEMKPGDSFFIEEVTDVTLKMYSLRVRAYQKGITIAMAPEKGGLRVWLIGSKNKK
jgi:hypothetical protein